MNIKEQTTLKEFLQRIQQISDQGYDCYIEGVGDGSFKLVIEDPRIRIVKTEEDGTSNR